MSNVLTLVITGPTVSASAATLSRIARTCASSRKVALVGSHWSSHAAQSPGRARSPSLRARRHRRIVHRARTVTEDFHNHLFDDPVAVAFGRGCGLRVRRVVPLVGEANDGEAIAASALMRSTRHGLPVWQEPAYFAASSEFGGKGIDPGTPLRGRRGPRIRWSWREHKNNFCGKSRKNHGQSNPYASITSRQ